MQVKDGMLQQIEDKEIELGTNGEQIVNDVHVGKNIAVPLDDLDDPIWVMLVIKCVHVTEEKFTNGWNNIYEVGDVIICRYWYERLQ